MELTVGADCIEWVLSGHTKVSVVDGFSSDSDSIVDILYLMEPSDVDWLDILDEEDEE
jgi:hypothetical protein